MLSLSGTLVLVSGILGATFAAISYGLATRGNRIAFQGGRIGARASLGMTLLAAALLVYAFAALRHHLRLHLQRERTAAPLSHCGDVGGPIRLVSDLGEAEFPELLPKIAGIYVNECFSSILLVALLGAGSLLERRRAPNV